MPCRALLKVMAANVVERRYRKKNSEKEGGGQQPEDISKQSYVNPRQTVSRGVQSMLNNLRMSEIENCLQQRKGANLTLSATTKFSGSTSVTDLRPMSISEFPDIGFKSVKGVESALLRLSKWVGWYCLRVFSRRPLTGGTPSDKKIENGRKKTVNVISRLGGLAMILQARGQIEIHKKDGNPVLRSY